MINISDNKQCVIPRHIIINRLAECSETSEMLRFYSNLSLEKMSINNIFEEVCWVVYASGFRYDIIKKYWPLLREEFYNFDVNKVAAFTNNPNIQAEQICYKSGFKNLRKAKWCIENASRIIEIDHENKHIGGIRGYFLCISKKNPVEFIKIAPQLVCELGFKGIGKTTIFHLMKNLGMNIFKPDIHVRRILFNLGFITSENVPANDVFSVMRYLSSELGLKINELDTILFNYGRMNGDILNHNI